METKRHNLKNLVFALAAMLAFGLQNIAMANEDPTVTIAPLSGTTSYMAVGTSFDVSAVGTPGGGEYKWSLSSTGGGGSLSNTDWSMNNSTMLSSNDAGATHNVTVTYRENGGIPVAATSGDIVVLAIEIVAVPEFLFASAENATTIKWKLHGFSDETAPPELNSVNLVFHPKEGASVALEEQVGFMGYTVELENGTYETYIKPTHLRAIELGYPYVSNTASFTLAAEFGEDALQLTANSGSLIKVFADNTIFAVDIAESDGYRSFNDNRAVVHTEPEKRWSNTINENMPDLWYMPSVQQTMDFDATFRQHGYWPAHSTTVKPRFILYDNSQGPDNPFMTAPLLTDTTTSVKAASIENHYYNRVEAEEPDVNYVGWNSSAIGRGHYRGDVVGHRVGVAVFISYGGKTVTVPAEGEITAMDLSIHTPSKIDLHGLNVQEMYANVNKGRLPPDGMQPADWVRPAIAAAAITSVWIPGAGKVIGPVLGLGLLIYDEAVKEINPNPAMSGIGFAKVQLWSHARRSSDSEYTIIEDHCPLLWSKPGWQVTTMHGQQIQQGVSLPVGFEGRNLKVGDMFSIFADITTTAQMEAKKTGSTAAKVEVEAGVKLSNPHIFSVRLDK